MGVYFHFKNYGRNWSFPFNLPFCFVFLGMGVPTRGIESFTQAMREDLFGGLYCRRAANMVGGLDGMGINAGGWVFGVYFLGYMFGLDLYRDGDN